MNASNELAPTEIRLYAPSLRETNLGNTSHFSATYYPK